MVTGFSNEKSAEFVVLNDLYRKIKNEYSVFYPFSFQKNRDDTMISFNNNVQDLHFIALFSRRPKTNNIGSSQSVVSFRSTHLLQASFFKEHGIPVIAAAPIGTSIETISFGAKCQWFKVTTNVFEEMSNLYFLGGTCITESDNIECINEDELLLFLRNTKLYSWTEVVGKIRNWYDDYLPQHSNNFFNVFRGQKPIFIVYKQ
ncbi:hypothetical protein HCA78_17050 [Listeria booriae]|uniref:Uncharacterized protein n=1 Tax=Listeria booriae TaxID=1552123 RepID=A0A842CZN3_9LIST|nr:hypothetical protein [Listeria booriae]MBC2005484.1 hypothetical protein [Listeria booriae]MBC2328424.1 hypothetical protein [Listeria booriae]